VKKTPDLTNLTNKRRFERPGRVLPPALRAPSEAWLLRTLHELRRSESDAPVQHPVQGGGAAL
jgi:hypothetical protein